MRFPSLLYFQLFGNSINTENVYMSAKNSNYSLSLMRYMR